MQPPDSPQPPPKPPGDSPDASPDAIAREPREEIAPDSEPAETGAALASPVVQPTAPSERIASLDVLRGFAVLGILLMNILAFGLPMAASSDPTLAGGTSTADIAAWAINYVLTDGKMRAIFSMLFGAGIVLLTGRAERRVGMSPAELHYRRNLWLLAIGLADAYLLVWFGDILFAYGVCGCILYPFRKLRPVWLIALAALVWASIVPKEYAEQERRHRIYEQAMEADKLESLGEPLEFSHRMAQSEWELTYQSYKPEAWMIAQEIELQQEGDYATLFRMNVWKVSFYHGETFFKWTVWDVLGMMFLGMALMKAGFFSAEWSRRAYGITILVGYGIGIPLNVWRAHVRYASEFGLLNTFPTEATFEIARLLVGMAHASVVILIAKSGGFRWMTMPLAAAGQMALTNYVMQNAIGTLIFNGYGFGLFGELYRHELYYVVAAIWAFQLLFSLVWMRLFRFGPLEWLWRTLTYWRVQPWLRKS